MLCNVGFEKVFNLFGVLHILYILAVIGHFNCLAKIEDYVIIMIYLSLACNMTEKIHIE